MARRARGAALLALLAATAVVAPPQPKRPEPNTPDVQAAMAQALEKKVRADSDEIVAQHAAEAAAAAAEGYGGKDPLGYGGTKEPKKPDAEPEDKRWFKKWRGERPGLAKGEKGGYHSPRPAWEDFDQEKALKALPVTEEMVELWLQEEDQPAASFAYTLALALGGLAGLPGAEAAPRSAVEKVTVHAIGAAKYREAKIEETFATLCSVVKLNPSLAALTAIDIVLVGPSMPADTDKVQVDVDGCTTTVSVFRGGYSEEVLAAFPDKPDLVVGFDVDAYTCSWRKSLLYIIQTHLPTVFSFMMPHEALWVEELLAYPSEAFGPPALQECTEDLQTQKDMLAKLEAKEAAMAVDGPKKGAIDGAPAKPNPHTVTRDEMAAIMGSAPALLDWTPPTSKLELDTQLDFFITPFAQAPMIGNNPFGGKRVKRGVHDPKAAAAAAAATRGDPHHDHDKRVLGMFGHPNSHLLGFVATAEPTAEPEQKKAHHLLGKARERLKEEGRPIVSRWNAMDTNRAIREKVPGWTANLS